MLKKKAKSRKGCRRRTLWGKLSSMGNTFDLTDDQIRPVAEHIWKENGCPEGTADADWFEARCVLEKQMAEAMNAGIQQRRSMTAGG